MSGTNQPYTLALRFDSIAAAAGKMLAPPSVKKRGLKPRFTRASTINRQLEPAKGLYYKTSIRLSVCIANAATTLFDLKY